MNAKRWMRACVMALVLTAPAASFVTPAAAQQTAPKPANDGFVPIDELPPDEKLPAAPLLIAAYIVAWLAIAGYAWSIWQRLGRVERQLGDVSRRVQSGKP